MQQPQSNLFFPTPQPRVAPGGQASSISTPTSATSLAANANRAVLQSAFSNPVKPESNLVSQECHEPFTVSLTCRIHDPDPQYSRSIQRVEHAIE